MAFQQTASKLASNDDNNLVKKLSPETAERIYVGKVYVMNVHYFGRSNLPTEAERAEQRKTKMNLL